MTRKGQRIKIIDLRKPHLPSVELGSIRLGIQWLKDNNLKPFLATHFSDYFRLHPERCCYVPDNRQYLVVKLEEYDNG